MRCDVHLTDRIRAKFVLVELLDVVEGQSSFFSDFGDQFVSVIERHLVFDVGSTICEVKQRHIAKFV